MTHDLTDFQVALLCAIEEHDDSESTSDQKRDLERLIAGGYVQRKTDRPGSAFALTAKGAAFLGELGAGLNEA
jgi:CTP-dependent riboflavin kinase